MFDIASQIADTTEFGTTDDLYTIGFTSLTLMKLNSLIYEELGVNLEISVLFNNPTIKSFADIVLGEDSSSSLDKFIESAKDMEYFPLTENQMGIYYECIQNPYEIKYTMPTVVRFDSDVNADKLKEAVIKTIEAHPYIKTRIVSFEDGSLKQLNNKNAEIDEIEIVELDENITDEEIIFNDVKAFTLGGEQLFRFKIYKTPTETVLFSDFHHIITDGVSQSFIFDDIANAYNGEELSNEIVDGFVYSLIETELSNSEKYDEAREFFNEKLSQEIESTILNPNLNGDEDKGKIKNIVKDIDVNRIDKYCKDNSISKNALFLSATILNLNKYTFRSDSLITTIFNGRANSNYYNTQGFLVKTLPLIIDSSDRQVSIKDFIKNVDKSWKDTINNSYYPYTKIAEEYQLKPEFFYAYHEFDNGGGIVIDGKSYSDYELSDDDLTTGEFKTNLQILDNGNTVNFEISYNDQLYTRDYIETFLDSILLIVDKFMEVNTDSVKISDIELVSDVEVPEFYEVEIPFIHKRFESQVKETPNNTALTACNETLTYSELNKKANRIANALIEKGVKPKSNVLVMLPRDSRLILAIMGILKAGCAYIPIDLEYPQERIDYIYENSQADYIISDETSGNSIDIADLLNNENESNPKVNLLPTDTAYMIYTSGSTGNPKGVMISHRNITNLFTSSKNNLVYNEYLKLNKFLAITTVSFDPFLLDFMALTFGIEIVLANDEEVKNIKELVDLIEREKPDAIPSSTPSRLNQYFEFEGFRNVMHYFKYMCMGGEMMPEDLYDNFSKYTNASIYNAYGPTETTVMSNSKKINDVDKITIGKPLHNYVTDVRDIDGKLLPLGVMGELYIGGVGVGKGYYNMDDKTEEVYLKINNVPYYRSGDYAVALPDGEIDIKGRIDNQIKLRGLRIEIGEIESNIAKYSNIKQCVVVIKEINNNDHLCAYYTADGEINDNELKEYLKERLTKYMVPTAFMQLDEIPQTPNGKTDTKNLPIPTLKLENVKPENETEEKLFKLASDLINTDQFGTTDDLYALGYTSLILMKLNSMIYEELGVNLDISILFNNPTIKNFAAEIASGSGEDDKLKEIIKSAKDMEYFPLTENQLGIYYECAQNPDEIKYTMPNVSRFEGSIDAEKLKSAIIKAINAHPYLKTRIVTTEEATLKQHKNNDIKIDDIEIVKVNSITDEEIMKNDVKVFQLNDSQLFRFKIYDCNDEIVLFSDFHHIITDGVSQINFFNDVVSIYEGSDIEEEKVDGYTYSLIEKSLESGEKFESAKKFFRDKMGQEIESTVLTPNLNGNPDEGKIKVITDNIDSKIIKKFCKDNLISQNALFMASTILNLNKFTFNSKTLITTISNGRLNPNYERTQGMLVKTLPIITNNENREITIREFIKQVDDTWIDTINNSNYPYTKIAEEYQLRPEFFYAYQEFFESESLKINGTDFDSYALLDDENIVATEYKVDLSINDSETETELQLSFNDQLYTEEYAYKFLHSIKNIINQFINGNIDELRIGDIELETDRQLPQFKPVEIPFIHERFEKQVNIKPDEVALVASDSTLTYSELNQKANRIANALIKKGVTAKSNVLVMLPRTSDLIASLIGVLKAGCAFIPIDMEYPKERIEYIYENSQADYIISDGVIENSLDVKELLKEENNNNINVAMHPDDLAYMIYTSGSTGNPKGVMISHENACNQTAFDTSLEDILTGITHGIKIIFANDSEIKNIVDLISLIKENKPEVMEFTPSRLLSYLEIKEFCEVIGCAKCIVMGGEQFSAKAFNGVKKYTDAKVYNSYGPTEATIASNYKEITDPDNITIGKALLNYVTEVRDIDGKLLPDGVMGELYIGGTGVGKGYYNMDDKTKEVLVKLILREELIIRLNLEV
ncbi:non-ribosomal peptide synthetase [uncultured Methanobrevibacter sp.]|uniref:non-ribosomal peptide synthetase n=1 Tax=uncultured Methanobrevibacter sp. TaxID=253161 RepID=UPI0025CCD077|nr:non-ribosomal peptide synthetase [uncultured Methanobrevibacter sp.]